MTSKRLCGNIRNLFGRMIVGDRETGVVKWFSDTKGYGFLTREGKKDVFVHHTAIDMEGHRSLAEGDEVEFTVEEGAKGLQAVNVVKLHK